MRLSKPMPSKHALERAFWYDPEIGVLFRIKFVAGEKHLSEVGAHQTSTKYRQVSFEGKIYLAHRIVWVLAYGAPPKGEVDHIDGNPLNNRLENLRSVTAGQNNQNRRLGRRNTSGIKGVFWIPAHQRWRGIVVYKGKQHYAGQFADKDQAARAVALKRLELHGSYANNG